MDDVGLKEGLKVLLCEKCAAMVRKKLKTYSPGPDPDLGPHGRG
jgi:hypothetical protein